MRWKMFKQIFHQTRRILAKRWLAFFPEIKIIGVTGSYGKTNTVRAIEMVLSEKFKVLTTDINLDTIYNLPITLLKLRPSHDFLLLEYGIDHLGEMDKHLSLVKSQTAVLTGISPVHADKELLGSLEGIIKEKGKLLESLSGDGLAILNYDDLLVRQMAAKIKAKVVWYGTDKSCDFYAEKIKVDLDGTSFTLVQSDKIGQRTEIKIGLIGSHFVQEALAAAAMGLYYGLTREEVKRGLFKLKPLKGRMSREKGFNNSIMLDDHLRANPASVIAGLETLAQLPSQANRIAVLGEMKELGQYAEEEHRKIGKKAAGLKLDYLLGIGDLQKLTTETAVKAGMKKEQVFWLKDVAAAAEQLKELIKPGDLWYLKGSLLTHLERIPLILNGETVKCQETSCHHYYQCDKCDRIK